jgi:hypothetical protein
LFERSRLGDERIEITERKRAAMPELVGVECEPRRSGEKRSDNGQQTDAGHLFGSLTSIVRSPPGA